MTPAPSTEASGDLVHLLAFPDQGAPGAAWDAFRADPEWQVGKAAGEVDGPLVVKLTSTILWATDDSPLA